MVLAVLKIKTTGVSGLGNLPAPEVSDDGVAHNSRPVIVGVADFDNGVLRKAGLTGSPSATKDSLFDLCGFVKTKKRGRIVRYIRRIFAFGVERFVLWE